MPSPIVIDGSCGEGGGQLLRTAVALAAITGRTLQIHHIRAGRPKSGLAPQHLAAVRAVGWLCGARIEGLALRSRSLAFVPGEARGGKFVFDVGTAGHQIVAPDGVAHSVPLHRVRAVWRDGELIWRRERKAV